MEFGCFYTPMIWALWVISAINVMQVQQYGELFKTLTHVMLNSLFTNFLLLWFIFLHSISILTRNYANHIQALSEYSNSEHTVFHKRQSFRFKGPHTVWPSCVEGRCKLLSMFGALMFPGPPCSYVRTHCLIALYKRGWLISMSQATSGFKLGLMTQDGTS